MSKVKEKSNHRNTRPKKPENDIVIHGKDYTFGQSRWIEDRARLERKTKAQIVRDAIDFYRSRIEKDEDDIVKQTFE